MMLGELLSARETINRVYSVRIKNGAAAFRLRREIEKLNEEIQVFMKLRDEKMREYGVKELKPRDPHYDDMLKWVGEAFRQEIQVKVVPAISQNDLENIPMSLQDIDNLLKLGLMAEN